MEREPKNSPPHQPPPRSFTRPIFRAVFDSRSSFIAPSLQRRLRWYERIELTDILESFRFEDENEYEI